jgi:hypothetical protein
MLAAAAGQQRALWRAELAAPPDHHPGGAEQQQMPHTGQGCRPADQRRTAQPAGKPRHARRREANRTTGSACRQQPPPRQPPAYRSAVIDRHVCGGGHAGYGRHGRWRVIAGLADVAAGASCRCSRARGETWAARTLAGPSLPPGSGTRRTGSWVAWIRRRGRRRLSGTVRAARAGKLAQAPAPAGTDGAATGVPVAVSRRPRR